MKDVRLRLEIFMDGEPHFSQIKLTPDMIEALFTRPEFIRDDFLIKLTGLNHEKIADMLDKRRHVINYISEKISFEFADYIASVRARNEGG